MSGKLQRQVQAAIDELVASGDDIGLQVAVMHHGRLVVDAVAGVADQRTDELVTPGTLFFAASTQPAPKACTFMIFAIPGITLRL